MRKRIITGVGITMFIIRADYYYVDESNEHHQQCDNVGHPANPANMSEDSSKLNASPIESVRAKRTPAVMNNQQDWNGNHNKNNRSHKNGNYQPPIVAGFTEDLNISALSKAQKIR